MDPKKRYREILDKHQWAVKHLDKLDTAVADFRKSNPCEIRSEVDVETGDVAYYAGEVPTVPSNIPLIAGDALHSLRGALDYLACGLVNVETTDTKFPIAHTAKAFEDSLPRVVERLGQDGIEALRRIRPYKGGNPSLWLLHKLNINDKHRLLLTVGMQDVGRTLTPDEVTAHQAANPNGFWTVTGGKRVYVYTAAVSPVTLHTGQKLLTVPGSKAQQKVRFVLDVALNEPGLAEGTPLGMILRAVAFEVERIVKHLSKLIVR
jgi:hypothetical protein